MQRFWALRSLGFPLALLLHWLREQVMPSAIAYVVLAEDDIETNIADGAHQSVDMLVVFTIV